MKKNLLFSKKQQSFARLCILIALVAIVFQNCKKDLRQNDAVIPVETSAAKSWYQHTFKPAPIGSDLKVAAVGDGQAGIELGMLLSPMWDNALAYEQDGEQVLELPSSHEIASLMLSRQPRKEFYDLTHPESISKLLIIKNKAGDYRAYVMSIIADAATVMPDSAKLALNTFKHKEADFNGLMLFHTLQGKLVSGYQYINGKAAGLVSAAQPPGAGKNTQSTNGTKVNIIAPQPCMSTELTWGVTSCTGYFVNGDYQGHDCRVSYDVIGYVIICPDNGPMVQLPMPGGGGGGSVASNITNDVNNRLCVASILNTIEANLLLNSAINSLFANTSVSTMILAIANSPNYNVTLKEAVIPDLTDNFGNVSRYNAQTIPQNGSITTTLNSNYLNSATDLSVARTIVHELVHAYFAYGVTYSTTDPNFSDFQKENALLFTQGAPNVDQNDAQHRQIAETYTNGLTTLLVNFANSNGITSPVSNQSLESYCNDLVWGGLQGTPAYQLFLPRTQSRINDNINHENNNTTGSTKIKGC